MNVGLGYHLRQRPARLEKCIACPRELPPTSMRVVTMPDGKKHACRLCAARMA